MACKYRRPAAVHKPPDTVLVIAIGRYLRQLRHAVAKRLFIRCQTKFERGKA